MSDPEISRRAARSGTRRARRLTRCAVPGGRCLHAGWRSTGSDDNARPPDAQPASTSDLDSADSGGAHDERHLNHRAKKITRPVPNRPELVTLLRSNPDRYGTSPDGRLFYGRRGAMLSESVYGRVWQRARTIALSASA